MIFTNGQNIPAESINVNKPAYAGGHTPCAQVVYANNTCQNGENTKG